MRKVAGKSDPCSALPIAHAMLYKKTEA